MKIFRWIYDNILFLVTLFLFAFIPLYPKRPLLDVQHTWVYIRVEDFVIVFVLLLWVGLLLLKKITLKTPLTLPIIIFWIIGGIATMHGALLIFPTLSEVYPNLAFLSYLRRIEYVSVFFLAYAGIRDKRAIYYIVGVITITLLLVVAYGIGQKFYGFPAFLTMNEEFAKGIPIQLSSLSRIPSTFAGHYDLAAYLVLVIPLLTSMIFGFRNWFIKLFLLGTVSLGFALLFMTVSRVSFFVLFLSLLMVLFFQKRKLVVISIFPIVLLTIGFLIFSPSLLARFGNTVKETNVLISATKGEAIGHVIEVPSSSFGEREIRIELADSKSAIDVAINKKEEDYLTASPAGILYTSQLPLSMPLIVESNAPTGENLPQGTGYINLQMAPIVNKIGRFMYQKTKNDGSTEFALVAIDGNFLIKKARAYDLSFTTRFQGEWPRALDAFQKNIFLGSGYGSVSLAVDNNYFRILGEVGILGFLSFFGIFFVAGIYVKKVLPDVDSPLVKSFVLGSAAGIFGLALNATLIDVFEASKIAFFLWLLVGVTVGMVHLYQKKEVDIYEEFKKMITSPYAGVIYLCILAVIVFSSIANYYFVGDDYTWLRWAADCIPGGQLQECPSVTTRIIQYFTNADGFFYRPGTKLYFLLMYSGFWLNQTVYHMVSISLHLIVAILFFFLARNVVKNNLLSLAAAMLFLVLSGYAEAVFWISSTGHLFNAVFILLSLLFYIAWKEKKKVLYFVLSMFSIMISMFFHELGVVAPLLIIAYDFVMDEKFTIKDVYKKTYYYLLASPLLVYLVLRLAAKSHWFNGDYSYNLFKLPYNFVGNAFGYFILDLLGPASLPVYQIFRSLAKEHLFLGILASVIVFGVSLAIYALGIRKMKKEEQRVILFGFLFFIITLLPFLGLGNITSRYSYLSSIGFILIFVICIKKLYEYLSSNGRAIASACIVVVMSIFFFAHLIQLQKIHQDWEEAGERSKRFFMSIDKVYETSWTQDPLEFYFINVPIHYGDAWAFPVGLPDALWFVFHNKNINVHKLQTLEEGLPLVAPLSSNRVFLFLENGSVDLITPEKKLEILMLQNNAQ